MALAVEFEYGSVMHEAINDGARCHCVQEHVNPIRKCEVCCDADAFALVRRCNRLKEQISCFALERNVSKLVDQ